MEEETGEPTANGPPDGDDADGDESDGDGMFDLSLPPAPEVDQADDKGPTDELDEFLKGLK